MSEGEEGNWKDSVPEALRDAPYFKNAENMEQVVNDLTNAAQYQGNSVRIPGPDAGAEDWGAFEIKMREKVPDLIKVDTESEEGRMSLMKRLGLPDNVEGYEAGEEGAWLADVAHKSGLTKAQFKSLVDGVNETNKSKKNESDATRAVELEALYDEWGLSKPKKLEHIKGLAQLTDIPASIAKAVEDGTADAATLRWLDAMASQFAEASNFADDKNTTENLTPIEAKSRIQELMNNPDYFKENDIGKSLRLKMVELQKAAHPDSDTSDLRGFG